MSGPRSAFSWAADRLKGVTTPLHAYRGVGDDSNDTERDDINRGDSEGARINGRKETRRPVALSDEACAAAAEELGGFYGECMAQLPLAGMVSLSMVGRCRLTPG